MRGDWLFNVWTNFDNMAVSRFIQYLINLKEDEDVNDYDMNRNS